MAIAKPALWVPGRNLDVLDLWRGCVAYYPMWMGAGLTAYDLSPYHNDGTLTNMDPPTDWVPTKMGWALDLDGTNDHIVCGSNPSLDNIRELTVAAWVYIRGWGESNYGRIAQKTTAATTDGWMLILDGAGVVDSLAFAQFWDGNHGQWNTAAGTLSLGKWWHLAVTYNGGSTANNPTLYINGVSMPITEEATPAGNIKDDSAGDLWLGARQNNARYFNGQFGTAEIWRRILSAGEIALLCATSFVMIRPPEFMPFWDVAAAAAGGITRQVIQAYRRING